MKPFTEVKGLVSWIMDQLVDDSAVAESLTYQLYNGQVFSSEEGRNIDSFLNFNVVGVRTRKLHRFVGTMQGQFEKIDQFFLFRIEDMPNNLSGKDKILDSSGKIYTVIAPIRKIIGEVVSVQVDAA